MRHTLTAELVRQRTIKLSCSSGAGHLAPALSTVEMLTVLFRDYLRFDENNPYFQGRDRLVFSKGHGAYAYYVILNECGLLPDFELENFYSEKATIKGCLTANRDYMIEASTGSLGHGLPIAVGMAQAIKMRGSPNKVVCIVGDGEMQEGSNFEALQLAYRFKLDNLLLIVDANGLQAMDFVKDVALDNDRLSKVLSSYVDAECFGDIDGHDEVALKAAFGNFFSSKSKKYMQILFCRTVKGKGVEMMENKANYHFRCPTQDGYVYIDNAE